jgi:3',5'-cyclic AMP phosphodiesterase CpdA
MRVLAHLSDLHFGRVEATMLEPLRRSLEHAAPDLVVVSGDLTQRARPDEFREAREYLDSLPGPRLVVPGNHDVPLYNVFQRFFAPLAKYQRIVSPDLEPDFFDDEIAVVGVNTARSLVFKGGRINEEQVERIRAKICDLPREVTKIVVTHHPFSVPPDSDDEDQIVGRARMALEKLAGCGADVFLSGHLHEAHVGHTANRYRIAGISALVVQAGSAISSRTRGADNSFNVLRVGARHIEIDRYAWKDQAFVVDCTEAFAHDAGGWHAVGGDHAAA